MAWAVVCNTRLGSVRWHHAGPRGMRHGTSGGTRHVSWLGSRAPCKALWHASWHGWWHASRVLAQLMGTMQGPMARVACLSLARGHNARPQGLRHGMGGGTRYGTGSGTREALRRARLLGPPKRGEGQWSVGLAPALRPPSESCNVFTGCSEVQQ